MHAGTVNDCIVVVDTNAGQNKSKGQQSSVARQVDLEEVVFIAAKGASRPSGNLRVSVICLPIVVCVG